MITVKPAGGAQLKKRIIKTHRSGFLYFIAKRNRIVDDDLDGNSTTSTNKEKQSQNAAIPTPENNQGDKK